METTLKAKKILKLQTLYISLNVILLSASLIAHLANDFNRKIPEFIGSLHFFITFLAVATLLVHGVYSLAQSYELCRLRKNEENLEDKKTNRKLLLYVILLGIIEVVISFIVLYFVLVFIFDFFIPFMYSVSGGV